MLFNIFCTLGHKWHFGWTQQHYLNICLLHYSFWLQLERSQSYSLEICILGQHIHDVKIWCQTSNFDVGYQIGSKVIILPFQGRKKAWRLRFWNEQNVACRSNIPCCTSPRHFGRLVHIFFLQQKGKDQSLLACSLLHQIPLAAKQDSLWVHKLSIIL